VPTRPSPAGETLSSSAVQGMSIQSISAAGRDLSVGCAGGLQAPKSGRSQHLISPGRSARLPRMPPSSGMERGDLLGGLAGDEQPTAPYLDAVVAYAFRGTARYHVPGHKGGPGADPGVRKAIGSDALAADVPRLVHGIDIGPEPRPYDRAERLAAEAYGARRTFFLTNGATQGNHALCLALAPLGARIVVQRNAHAAVVDGLVLSGGIPTFVAPEYDAELGKSSPRRPTTGWRPTSPRSRRSPTARACRSSSTSRGGRTSASTPRCRRARSPRAPMPC
jgi:Orn/Lys/Arg decarboxylase, major domain